MTHAHVLLAALATAGCAKSPKDSPAAGSRIEPEAPGSASAASRFSGEVSGHRFTITVEGGRVTRSGPDVWTWAMDGGEVSVHDIGAVNADTHFLVERSPRTIVRGGAALSIYTEVVLVAGGRVISCAHEQRVEDPDSPAARAAVDRGVATCTSLRVEP